MQFIAARISISSQLTERSNPSRQFLVIFMAIKSVAIMTGNPSMAIRILLLLALAAIPDKRVREEESPNEVSKINRIKSLISCIGFCRKTMNKTKPVSDREVQRTKL